MRIQLFAAMLILCTAGACGNRSSQQPASTTASNAGTQASLFKISAPAGGSVLKVGDTLTISYSAETDSPKADSCILSIGGKKIAHFTGNTYRWNTAGWQVGSLLIRLDLLENGKVIATLNASAKLYPPAPQFYTYKVVKESPHNTEWYTQGLFIDSDVMYESTGLNGHSTLNKVDLASGKASQTILLDKQYFGEGSTLLNGKIYLLTYQSRKGFVYDAATFKQVSEFAYDTEGWGLTTDGEYLIMSDGSSIIRFMTPDTFKEVKRIEVCTDKGPVNMINELEYINGEIWANLYTQPAIICINPNTGAVSKVVDMRGLQPESSRSDEENVLNGIAYNHRTKQLYVTGKRWPKLFEVKFEPKPEKK